MESMTLQDLERKYPGISELLGKISDTQIGDKFGITKQAVSLHRKRHKIPSATIHRREQILATELPNLLGQYSDSVLADQFQISRTLVAALRKNKQISSPEERRKLNFEQIKEEIVPYLGTVHDSFLAEMFEVSVQAVKVWRTKRGIKPFQKWHKFNQLPREEVRKLSEQGMSIPQMAEHFQCCELALKNILTPKNKQE